MTTDFPAVSTEGELRDLYKMPAAKIVKEKLTKLDAQVRAQGPACGTHRG